MGPQEYWSGQPIPSPADLLDPGIELRSPALQADSLLAELPGKPKKTLALTICTFVSKVISLPFNALSMFVTAFLPRSNHLLITWLQSPSAVLLEPSRGYLPLLPPFPLLFAMK